MLLKFTRNVNLIKKELIQVLKAMNLDAYKKTNLNGAHNSLVDAKAQTDIVVSSQFMPYLDKNRSYRSISNIWSATAWGMRMN